MLCRLPPAREGVHDALPRLLFIHVGNSFALSLGKDRPKMVDIDFRIGVAVAWKGIKR